MTLLDILDFESIKPEDNSNWLGFDAITNNKTKFRLVVYKRERKVQHFIFFNLENFASKSKTYDNI